MEKTSDRLQKILRQVVELRSREWTRLGISTTIDLQPTPTFLHRKDSFNLLSYTWLINAEEAAVRNPGEASNIAAHFHDELQRKVRMRLRTTAPHCPRASDRCLNLSKRPRLPVTGAGSAHTVRNIVERIEARWFDTTRGSGTIFIVELSRENWITATSSRGF